MYKKMKDIKEQFVIRDPISNKYHFEKGRFIVFEYATRYPTKEQVLVDVNYILTNTSVKSIIIEKIYTI
jgi:hypothetical protein